MNAGPINGDKGPQDRCWKMRPVFRGDERIAIESSSVGLPRSLRAVNRFNAQLKQRRHSTTTRLMGNGNVMPGKLPQRLFESALSTAFWNSA